MQQILCESDKQKWVKRLSLQGEGSYSSVWKIKIRVILLSGDSKIKGPAFGEKKRTKNAPSFFCLVS